MPRQLRQFFPGVSVHLIHRGNNRHPIFADDSDRARFLTLVRRSFEQQQVAIHGYVLMTNHFHLKVTPAHCLSLPSAMKQLGDKYVAYFNRKHGRVGHLYCGRPREILIHDASYSLACLRYIEQNPVRAGMVTRPEDYAWSSYRVNALGEPCSWLTPHPCYLALGRTPSERQAAYRAMAEPPLSLDDLIEIRVDIAAAS